jgi:hypothetical protein
MFTCACPVWTRPNFSAGAVRPSRAFIRVETRRLPGIGITMHSAVHTKLGLATVAPFTVTEGWLMGDDRQIVIAIVQNKQRVVEDVENVHLQFQSSGFPLGYLEGFLDGNIEAIQRQALTGVAHQVTAEGTLMDILVAFLRDIAVSTSRKGKSICVSATIVIICWKNPCHDIEHGRPPATAHQSPYHLAGISLPRYSPK